MQRAILFPGQGAQHVGMGQPFLESEDAARDVFGRANDVLGFDLAKVCLEGPEDELNRTDICQPAILTCSIAIVECLRARAGAGVDLAGLFGATAGLSLGEYTALVFAGAISFEDAVALVRKRGQYMQQCSEAKPSGMVSLMGVDEAKAAEVCDQIRENDVAGVANLNGGGQVVVSGDQAAMERVVAVAGDHGIRRAIALKVAGAFHSELMRDAANRLEADLAAVKIQKPAITFLSNVTGAPVDDPEVIRKQLGEQVCSPVRWEQSMQHMIGAGYTEFVEPGPGKVLSALARKIDRSATVTSMTAPEEVDSVAAQIGVGEAAS